MPKILYENFRHIICATRYSIAGLTAAFRDEMAFRQICLLCLAGAPCAFFFADGWMEAMLLIFPLALSVIVELLNTAVESVVDRISKELNPLSKKAKDTASAAQFCTQILCLVVWTSFIARKLFE